MRLTNLIILAVAAGLGITAVSCGHKDKFIGTWTAISPANITNLLPAASTATSLTTMQLMPAGSNDTPGSVCLSSLIDITQPVDPAAGSFDQPYEVSVAATASVCGTWHYKGNEDDELLLSLDLNSITVTVDPAGVTYTENLLTGKQQPQLGSLTAATAALWKKQLTAAMRQEFGRFAVLDDIEVNRDGFLSLEIQSPDTELHFRRSE